MIRAVVEEAATLASLALFLGMIAIWAQVIAALLIDPDPVRLHGGPKAGGNPGAGGPRPGRHRGWG